MFRLLFLLFTLICCLAGSAQLQFTDAETNLGIITEACEIKGDVIIRNASAKKVYLLRADADKEVKVYTSKKTLQPNDTCLLIISFTPESGGKFHKTIRLVSSDQAAPYELSLSGTLSKLVANNKTACYYFGRRSNTTPVKEALVIQEPLQKRDNSNKMPDHSSEPPRETRDEEKNAAPLRETKTPGKENTSAPVRDTKELSGLEYKPNNILFLVDVSGSMKDSLKLPLMKEALHTLIDAVRDVDRITFVTYADSIKVISEGISGADKETLHKVTSGLRSHGLTKGNKAILFSQQLAQKHFIAEGNNQIFLATDGKFRFYTGDVSTWKERQAHGKIILSTVAFGSDREAMKNLKEIAEVGEGTFIHIKKRNGSREKLLDEVKERSRRH